MTRAKSAAEAIGFLFSSDAAEVQEYRYQPTRYAKIHVYAIGDTYYCATLPSQSPPDGWDWQLIDESPYHGRKVYKAQA